MSDDDLPTLDETRTTAPPGPASTSPPAKAGPPESIGPYRIERELARGGMGVVYVARHEKLEREVALKVLRAGEQVERLRTEARAVARLSHPNIVGIHDVGDAPDGRPYLVMDLIDGRPLRSVIKGDGPLEEERAARIALGVAEALAEAHRNAVLHRDVKPGNVLLQGDDLPILTDFGLAKDVEASGDAEGLTASGDVLGTPAYMPPEQALGELEKVDRRSDVYALGATLYEMLTGQAPFSGRTSASLLTAVLTREPERPSRLRAGLDRDLETICLRCLEKEPERRYDSASALADDLRRYLAHQPIAARPPSAADRARKWLRRNRVLAQTLAATVALALVVLVGLGVAFVDRVQQERDAATRERDRAVDAERKAQSEATRADRERDDARAQRSEAERQRREAERQRGEAERQRSQAQLQRERARKQEAIAKHQEQLAKARLRHTRRLQRGTSEQLVRVKRLLGEVLEQKGLLAFERRQWKRAAVLLAGALEYGERPARRGKARLALARAGNAALLKGHTEPVHTVAWSPDGKWIASGAGDGTVRVWDATHGRPRVLRGHTGPVLALSWSPAGETIASGSADGTARVWNPATGQVARTFKLARPVDLVQWTTSATGPRLLLGATRGTLEVWHQRTQQRISLRVRGVIRGAAFSPTGSRVAAVLANRTTCVWGADLGKLLLMRTPGLAFSRVGPKSGLVSRSAKRVRQWRGQSGVRWFPWGKGGYRLVSNDTVHVQVTALIRTYPLHPERAFDVAWAPDGQRFVSGSTKKPELRVWAIVKRRPVLRDTLAGHWGGVRALAWSRDGQRLASGSQDGTVRVWEVARAADLRKLAEARAGLKLVDLELKKDLKPR